MKTFGTDSDDEPSESFPSLGVKGEKKHKQKQKYNQLTAEPSLKESNATHRGLKFFEITSRGESEVTAFHL